MVISDFLCLDLVMTGFVPNIMALMNDNGNAGCMLLKGLSATGILKLIAQPEMVLPILQSFFFLVFIVYALYKLLNISDWIFEISCFS